MDKKTKIKVLTLMFLSALFLTAAGCQTKETTKMESKIYEAKTETVIENEEKIKDEEKVLDEKEGEVLGAASEFIDEQQRCLVAALHHSLHVQKV